MVERISNAESKIFVTITIAEIQSAAEANLQTVDAGNSAEEGSVATAAPRTTTAVDTARTFFSLPIPSTVLAPA